MSINKKKWRLRPRRGKKSVLQKKNILLSNGELIIELPDEGMGPISAKIGDGATR